MSDSYHVVLIETSGNQPYIFGTNKLAENVGASELTYRVGTQYVLEAVKRTGGPELWDPLRLRPDPARLTDPQVNRRIEDGAALEVLVATSGKAELLVRDPEVGRAIVRDVTREALLKAPGVEVLGTLSEKLRWSVTGSLAEGVRQVHERYEEARSAKPGAGLRFLRLPIVAECRTSGLPAAALWARPRAREGEGEQPEERSAVSIAKLEARDLAKERLRRLLQPHELFAGSLSKIEELGEADWQAVVHADGNGLGETFLNFDQHCSPGNRGYANDLRRFSLALDLCTEQAFHEALGRVPKARRHARRWPDTLLLVPLVIGGDDLTVVCDGACALDFTAAFLQAFEEETSRTDAVHYDGIIPRVAGRVSACAGVAIVKPHYPFYAAYELAEQLMSSAKQVKRQVLDAQGKPFPCSALDFHVLYDASGSDLDEIRKHMTSRDGTAARLYARPYVVSPVPAQGAPGAPASGAGWVEARRWVDLREQVAAIMAIDPETGRRVLPGSQLHELRAGLHLGQQEADSRLKLVRGRYKSLDKLLPGLGPGPGPGPGRNSLFGSYTELEPDGQPRQVLYAPLLDALEAADFIQGE